MEKSIVYPRLELGSLRKVGQQEFRLVYREYDYDPGYEDGPSINATVWFREPKKSNAK